jgi:lipid-A-disaccharide synthase
MEMMIVAGEASGDAHAAELVMELKRRHPELRVFGGGGQHLAAAGAELLVRAEELAVVGLFEVVAHLPRIYGFYRRLRRAMIARRPRAVILVDFPDFNLRLARAAHRAGVPVIYFISPQLWAWRRGRVRTIQRTVRRMICIFPFEPAFYARHGVEVTGVGHPLVDRVEAAQASLPTPEAWRLRLGTAPNATLVALLPGSRRREVSFHLPIMLEAARQLREQHPELEFVIPVAPTLDAAGLRAAAGGAWPAWAHVVGPDEGYAAIARARLAIVASGTATVETALLGTPMVVIYRLSALTYRLGRRLVKTPHYAMVNLIAGARVVPELIQAECNAGAIVHWANRLLPDGAERREMSDALQQARSKLGEAGAIARAATAIEEALKLAPAMTTPKEKALP